MPGPPSDLPWAESERRLSGKEPLVVDPVPIEYGDGSDAPPWTRSRPRYVAPRTAAPPPSTVDYAELHCHTNFSFLDGASQPEELAEEAHNLGLTGLAVTDHDGFYGVVRFSGVARELGPPTLFGAELSLDLPGPQNGEPDPAGDRKSTRLNSSHGYQSYSAFC